MLALCKEVGRDGDFQGLQTHKNTALAALPELQPRGKTLLELIDLAQFIYADRPLVVEDKAAKHLNDETRAMIGKIVSELSEIGEWNAQNINEAVRAFAQANDLKLGKVAQPLRVALTGRTISPGVFEVMALLGKQESLARLGDQSEPG